MAYTVLAIALGGLLLAAGVLLFVAAHWDTLSPAWRFTLVLTMVAVMHVAGAIASTRFSALSTTLHAVGTICLGAGIFLTGQIFNLQEHWPGGVMLWALGAWVAWAFLRDWPQAGLAAILTPAWLAGEWSEATQGMIGSNTYTGCRSVVIGHYLSDSNTAGKDHICTQSSLMDWRDNADSPCSFCYRIREIWLIGANHHCPGICNFSDGPRCCCSRSCWRGGCEENTFGSM